jgi:hypothetical protein
MKAWSSLPEKKYKLLKQSFDCEVRLLNLVMSYTLYSELGMFPTSRVSKVGTHLDFPISENLPSLSINVNNPLFLVTN